MLLVLSDIHGNMEALTTVLEYAEKTYKIDACAILGDLIDYGMHSNEVIRRMEELPYPILCNIYGNHEQAIVCGEYVRFSSDRGKDCAKYTCDNLDEHSRECLQGSMEPSGRAEFVWQGKKCLAVHGSLQDVYWGKLDFSDSMEEYRDYDYVFTGHSHIPHFMEKYYPIDNPLSRNRKKTIFINPGSVGQPRNLNNHAQFAMLDVESEKVVMEKVSYDIAKEQTAYHGQVDNFYKERLERGV